LESWDRAQVDTKPESKAGQVPAHANDLAQATSITKSAKYHEPSQEQIMQFASTFMKNFSQEDKFSDNRIATNLASFIYWAEKIQLVCPSYFYVNTDQARFEYLLL
jgi:hypothetical protein